MSLPLDFLMFFYWSRRGGVSVPNGIEFSFTGLLWSRPSLGISLCLRPGWSGAANRTKGKQKVSPALVAPPHASAVHRINRSLRKRVTFGNSCEDIGKFLGPSGWRHSNSPRNSPNTGRSVHGLSEKLFTHLVTPRKKTLRKWAFQKKTFRSSTNSPRNSPNTGRSRHGLSEKLFTHLVTRLVAPRARDVLDTGFPKNL